MTELDDLALTFQQERARLRGVAFRVLGSAEEAEDAVQETWIRFSRADVQLIDNVPGWLTTVTSRICLDLLRVRRSRAEGPLSLDGTLGSLPVSGSLSPEDEALLSDAVSRALLVVMQVLTPTERLSFVLHDVFKVPFNEISAIIQCSSGAAKMMASRARRRVQGMDPYDPTGHGRKREIVAAFSAAARAGDLDLLIEVLAPDVRLRVEGVQVEDIVVEGVDAVSSRAVRFGSADTRSDVVDVDGTVGIVTWRGQVAVAVLWMDISDDRIRSVRLTTDAAAIARVLTDIGSGRDTE